MSTKTLTSEKVDLSLFNNGWYNPGGSFLKRLTWFVVNAAIFNNPIIAINRLKILLLRLFGAKVGNDVIIKPNVNIKYPWFLSIGDHVWIGEKVWIDNLSNVIIGNNVSISQGALLLTGSHNYKNKSFDLIVGKIHIEDGVWIGAQATVCPGVTCRTHSILTVGSVATSDMESYQIYQGIPAEIKRVRNILES